MHVFNSNFTAISILKCCVNLAQSPVLLPCQDTTELWYLNVESAVKIGISESIEFVICQLSVGLFRALELLAEVDLSVDLVKLKWINISLEMTVSHVGADEGHELHGSVQGRIELVLAGSAISHGGTLAESTLLERSEDRVQVWCCTRCFLVAEAWWWLVWLINTFLDVIEVGLPRSVHAAWVL